MTITIPAELLAFLAHPICMLLGFCLGVVAGALGLTGWVVLTALTGGRKGKR